MRHHCISCISQIQDLCFGKTKKESLYKSNLIAIVIYIHLQSLKINGVFQSFKIKDKTKWIKTL